MAYHNLSIWVSLVFFFHVHIILTCYRSVFRDWIMVYGRRYSAARMAKLLEESSVVLIILHSLSFHLCTWPNPDFKFCYIILATNDLPILSDASVFRGISRSFAPLYFTVREVNEVMSTEQPCDVAYEFGSGLLDLQEYPDGFPKPG